MDGLVIPEFLGDLAIPNQIDIKSIEKEIKNENLSSSEAFQLVKSIADAVLKDKKDDEKVQELVANVLVGTTIGVFIQGEQGVLIINLKSGPQVLVRNDESQDKKDDKLKIDIKVIFESEEQFRGILSKRLEFQQLFKSGKIQVQGSLKSKMKLMPLANFAKKLERQAQEARNEKAMAGLDWESEPTKGQFQGYLEKKSDWLKSWNQRYFQLDWDAFHRPRLSYSLKKGGSTRGSVDLHSGCFAEARVTTRTDKPNQSAFAIVDRNTNTDLIVLCTDSDAKRSEWLQHLTGAITARARARASRYQGYTSLQTDQDREKNITTKSTDEISSINEEAHPTTSFMHQVEVAEAAMIERGTESHLQFILRSLSWRVVPLTLSAIIMIRKLFKRISAMVPSSLVSKSILIGVLTICVKTVMNSPRYELFRRRMTVFWMSAKIIFDLKITEMKTEQLPPIHSDACWKVKQKVIAEKLYFSSLRLGGLWVKLAQHIGARPDVFPPPITNVLSRLQDEVPGTPFDQLKPFLESEMGKPIHQVFETFNPEPLAVASIGQVHLATLLDGSQVVVKVQHPKIEETLRQDVANMGVVMGWVKIIQNQMDIDSILDHWRENVLKELDFESEMSNMIEVGNNLAAHKDEINATVPTGIQELSSKRMMVMRFVKGVKVTDDQGLASVGVSGYHARGVLADDLCNAFASMLLIDGLCNADPHAGNVLIASRESVSSGQTMHLPETETEKEEESKPVPVLLDFGLTLRLPDKIRLGLARMILAGSQLDVGSLMRSGTQLGIVMNRENFLEDFSGMQHVFRDTAPAGEAREEVQKRIEIEKAKLNRPEGFQNPVESFPPELIFVFRSLNLLRGLCSSLEVRQPFIKTLAKWAKRALLESYGPVVNPVPQPTYRPGLEEKIAAFLDNRGDDFVGIQLTVLDDSNDMNNVSIAKGTLSQCDPRLVSKETMFPCLSLSQSISQLCLRIALRRKGLTLKDLGSDFVSLGLLSGDLSQSPIEPTLVPESMTSKTAGDWKAHIQFVEEKLNEYKQSSLNDPKKQAAATSLLFELSHAAFFWGFAQVLAVEKAITGAKGGNVDGQVPEISKIAQELGMRLGFDTVQSAFDFVEEKGLVAQLSFPVEKLLEQHGLPDIGAMGDLENFSSDSSHQEQGGPNLESITEVVPGLKGKEFYIDPRMTNFPQFLAACLPNENVLASSEQLANVFHSISTCDGKFLPTDVAKEILAEINDTIPLEDPMVENRVGLTSFAFNDKKSSDQVGALGQFSFGGSLVFAVPEKSLTVSLLLNSLSLDRQLSEDIMKIIYDHYHFSLEI